MIDGIVVMTLTRQLDLLREQVERGERHSTILGPLHLTRLRKAAAALAWTIETMQESPVEQYLNASKGG